MVEAVVYLHDQNICHRDIKLENILLDNELSPKLIDFGFATCIDNCKKVNYFLFRLKCFVGHRVLWLLKL